MGENMAKSSGASFPDRPWEQDLAIIFSSRDGYVWASWLDSEASVRLGRHAMVTSMMRDFLAQDAIGVRLSEHRPSNPR
jgi:hypothetical protein